MNQRQPLGGDYHGGQRLEAAPDARHIAPAPRLPGRGSLGAKHPPAAGPALAQPASFRPCHPAGGRVGHPLGHCAPPRGLETAGKPIQRAVKIVMLVAILQTCRPIVVIAGEHNQQGNNP